MRKRKLLIFMIFAVCLLCLTFVIGRFYIKNFTAFSWENERYYSENGEVIQVKLKTRGGYRVASEPPFAVLRGDQVLCQMIFQTGEQHERCDVLYQNVMKEPTTGRINGNEYYFRSDESENNWEYGVYLQDIDFWVILRSDVSREAVEQCFDRMTFSCQKMVTSRSLDGQSQNLNAFYDDFRKYADRARELLGCL